MKSPLSLILLCVIVFSISACHKDTHSNTSPTDSAAVTPTKPDLTTKVTTTISGYVTNEADSPVAFALVSVGSTQVTTDQYGYFSIPGVSVPKTAGLVKVVSNGYFNGYRTITPQDGGTAFVRIQLLAKTEIGTTDAAAGGTVGAADGTSITLPASGVVNASDGSAYAGTVHVSARWMDPGDGASLQLQIPGDSRALDNSGNLKGLKSYGILAVELTSGAGQLLQIAPGKTAGIQIPISSALGSAAPASISLWSFNDTTGLWRQEGMATKTGSMYKGTTTHFSFWDGAEGADLVNFTAKIVDASSNPLANVPVSITLASLPQNVGYGRFGFTDANGNVSGSILANSSLVLQVLTPCAVAAYEHPFTTAATDVNLGQLTGNLGQSEVTLKGSVVNCSNQPVTNGYVQTYDHGFYNRIPVSNGAFNFSGLTCTNQPVNVVAVDATENQQSTPETVTLTAGVNDLGTLTACGYSTLGSISYTVDGTAYNLIEPKDTVSGFYLGVLPGLSTGYTQIATLSGDPNTHQQMSFQFDGGMDLGSTHNMNQVFSTAFPGGSASWPVSVPVTITEYGDVGGFIIGSINCNLIDADNTAIHPFTCSFRVRRYN